MELTHVADHIILFFFLKKNRNYINFFFAGNFFKAGEIFPFLPPWNPIQKIPQKSSGVGPWPSGLQRRRRPWLSLRIVPVLSLQLSQSPSSISLSMWRKWKKKWKEEVEEGKACVGKRGRRTKKEEEKEKKIKRRRGEMIKKGGKLEKVRMREIIKEEGN